MSSLTGASKSIYESMSEKGSTRWPQPNARASQNMPTKVSPAPTLPRESEPSGSGLENFRLVVFGSTRREP